MNDIIDFAIENAQNIKTYEITYYNDGSIAVVFILTNGDTYTFFEE